MMEQPPSHGPLPVAEPESEAAPRAEVPQLHVEAVPGRSHVLAGTKNCVRLLMRINAPQGDSAIQQQRLPLCVACVLDRSGSMGGQKLDFAKRAVSKLVKHLGPEDTLHFITYSNQATVIFRDGDLSETGKTALQADVSRVTAGGQTNLFEGLESAVKLLGRSTAVRNPTLWQRLKKGTDVAVKGDSAVRRIFLFSDGCVNVGVRDPETIRQRVAAWAEAGITTSTFGIGTDFDEPLMKGIAEAGKGKYAYLATAQDIPKLVSKSVHNLLDLYASEASLDIVGGTHTCVSRIFRADEDEAGWGGASRPAPGLLMLGDLHHGSERMALMELDVAPPGDAMEGVEFTAAKWTLTLQRGGAPAQISGRLELRTTHSRSTLGEETMAVQAAFAIQRAADIEVEVTEHLASRDRVRAQEAKSRQMSLLQGALQVAQRDAPGSSEVEILARVFERAQRVADQIEDDEDDDNLSLIRRHCVQETVHNRAMSVADWHSGCDSDDGDVANLDDLDGISPPSSPPPSPPRSPLSSPCGSPPPSPPRSGLPSSPSMLATSWRRSRVSCQETSRRESGLRVVMDRLFHWCSS